MLGQNELVSYQFSLFEFEQCARKRSKLAKNPVIKYRENIFMKKWIVGCMYHCFAVG